MNSLTNASSDYSPASVYCGLRDQILRLAGERSASGFNGTIGAMMETGYPKAVVTLVVLNDGTTSLYFSSGGGVIGAGRHKSVSDVASSFLDAAQANTSHMEPTTNYPLPRPMHARFYVLSTSGAWTFEALEQDLGHNRETLSPLFHMAHAVIAALREKAPADAR